MGKLKLKITDKLMGEINAEAKRLWPDQGAMAVGRLVRDSLRRFWRYSGGTDRTRNQDGQRAN